MDRKLVWIPAKRRAGSAKARATAYTIMLGPGIRNIGDSERDLKAA